MHFKCAATITVAKTKPGCIVTVTCTDMSTLTAAIFQTADSHSGVQSVTNRTGRHNSRALLHVTFCSKTQVDEWSWECSHRHITTEELFHWETSPYEIFRRAHGFHNRPEKRRLWQFWVYCFGIHPRILFHFHTFLHTTCHMYVNYKHRLSYKYSQISCPLEFWLVVLLVYKQQLTGGQSLMYS